MPLTAKRKRSLLGIICLSIAAIILAAGLWPFAFHPVNKVAWERNGEGVRFYGQGEVFSRGALIIAPGKASVTIELLIRPQREMSNMVASILTLFDGNREHFIFGQWKREMLIRIPAQTADRNKRYRESGVDNVLTKDTQHLITVTSGREKTAIYIDGTLKRTIRRFSLIPGDRELSGRLVFGNSPEGTNSWLGTVSGAAVYDNILTGKEIRDHYHAWLKQGQHLITDANSVPQTVTPAGRPAARLLALYLFDERGGETIHDRAGPQNNLLIPATFRPLRRTVLEIPEKGQWLSRWNLIDVTINILGFAPLGFFLAAWLRQMKHLPASVVYGLTILIGTALSLAIELVQVYLPMRDSSLLDVISNVMGTALGVFLLKCTLPRSHGSKIDLHAE